MPSSDDSPDLQFFQATPDSLMSRPPLCSSLQNIEATFFLIALKRFPNAFVMSASAVESAMKSVLNVPADKFINAEDLFAKSISLYPALSSFDPDELKDFRFTRNRIVHYGFTPRDDDVTATLLLQTGIPFLSACYKEFFKFDLRLGLAAEFGEQLGIALDVYANAKHLSGLHYSYCFRAFGHLIRRGINWPLMAGWEQHAALDAQRVGLKFDYCEKQKHELERKFGSAWDFDCPICDDILTFVCELDDASLLNAHVIALKRGACPSCGFVVPMECPFLVDALCRKQIMEKRDEILRAFGITDIQETPRPS